MNMVIMCHVHHLSTGMEGKNLEIAPIITLKNSNQVSPTVYLKDVKDYSMI